MKSIKVKLIIILFLISWKIRCLKTIVIVLVNDI